MSVMTYTRWKRHNILINEKMQKQSIVVTKLEFQNLTFHSPSHSQLNKIQSIQASLIPFPLYIMSYTARYEHPKDRIAKTHAGRFCAVASPSTDTSYSYSPNYPHYDSTNFTSELRSFLPSFLPSFCIMNSKLY